MEQSGKDYRCLTHLEKEHFAERFARNFWEKEENAGRLPFDPIVRSVSLERDGLLRRWFSP